MAVAFVLTCPRREALSSSDAKIVIASEMIPELPVQCVEVGLGQLALEIRAVAKDDYSVYATPRPYPNRA